MRPPGSDAPAREAKAPARGGERRQARAGANSAACLGAHGCLQVLTGAARLGRAVEEAYANPVWARSRRSWRRRCWRRWRAGRARTQPCRRAPAARPIRRLLLHEQKRSVKDEALRGGKKCRHAAPAPTCARCRILRPACAFGRRFERARRRVGACTVARALRALPRGERAGTCGAARRCRPSGLQNGAEAAGARSDDALHACCKPCPTLTPRTYPNLPWCSRAGAHEAAGGRAAGGGLAAAHGGRAGRQDRGPARAAAADALQGRVPDGADHPQDAAQGEQAGRCARARAARPPIRPASTPQHAEWRRVAPSMRAIRASGARLMCRLCRMVGALHLGRPQHVSGFKSIGGRGGAALTPRAARGRAQPRGSRLRSRRAWSTSSWRSSSATASGSRATWRPSCASRPRPSSRRGPVILKLSV